MTKFVELKATLAGEAESQKRAPEERPVRPKPASGRVAARNFRMDPRMAARAIEMRIGKAVDPAVVALKMADTDYTTVFDEHRNRVQWEVWDRTSPINGVAAEDVLARPEYGNTGSIYLVRVDGRVTLFQPHLPEVQGLQDMDDEGAEWVAAVHADNMVTEMTIASVVSTLLEDPAVLAPSGSSPEDIASAVVEAMQAHPRMGASQQRRPGRR